MKQFLLQRPFVIPITMGEAACVMYCDCLEVQGVLLKHLLHQGRYVAVGLQGSQVGRKALFRAYFPSSFSIKLVHTCHLNGEWVRKIIAIHRIPNHSMICKAFGSCFSRQNGDVGINVLVVQHNLPKWKYFACLLYLWLHCLQWIKTWC